MVVAGGKEFAPELLQELQQMAATHSRRQLARHLCQRLDWQGPTGRPALMSARKALSQLHRLGHLPAPIHAAPTRSRHLEPAWPAPAIPLPLSLAELGEVWLVPVTSRRCRLARVWKQMMAHHYLGAGWLCGHQLRYLVECSLGYLGALAFGAAALQIQARDQAIGWSELSRRHQLHRVVNNTRFLLLPWIQIPQLASHVLGLCAPTLAADWPQRYGYQPVLLESFVDRECYQGTCYAAAGWECVGQSRGRGRQDRQHQGGRSPKAIWLKPLVEDWRAQLQAPPPTQRLAPPRRRVPKTQPPALPPQNWAEAELGAADFGDRRLSRRLIELVLDFEAQPQAQIPEACGTKAKIMAAYRFFAHQNVKLTNILAPHLEQTLARMQSESVVLAVQDTTELDYTAHPQTEGLGPIGNHRPHVHGLELHPTVAFTTAGVALGLLDVQCWKRDPKHQPRFRQPVAQKEGVKWLKGFAAAEAAQARCPQTCVVSVGDCEADMFELYLQAHFSATATKFLVRAYRPRQQQDQQELWKDLGSRPARGTVRVQLPRREQRGARRVDLTVRYAQVELQAPKYMKEAAPVRVWAILLREETPPPPGAEAVEWMLLTNLAVESFEAAVEKTRWYGIRFQIEVYFRTLKSGCRIEDRQLATGRRLENCLGLDLLVAWRILYLSRQARQEPESSAEPYFDVLELRTLQELIRQDEGAAEVRPLKLREAVRKIAQLGGFIGRKRDGEPGAETLWRGLQHLKNIARGFALAQIAAGGPVSRHKEYG